MDGPRIAKAVNHYCYLKMPDSPLVQILFLRLTAGQQLIFLFLKHDASNIAQEVRRMKQGEGSLLCHLPSSANAEDGK
jgi:hypothetical protein